MPRAWAASPAPSLPSPRSALAASPSTKRAACKVEGGRWTWGEGGGPTHSRPSVPGVVATGTRVTAPTITHAPVQALECKAGVSLAPLSSISSTRVKWTAPASKLGRRAPSLQQRFVFARTACIGTACTGAITSHKPDHITSSINGSTDRYNIKSTVTQPPPTTSRSRVLHPPTHPQCLPQQSPPSPAAASRAWPGRAAPAAPPAC